jgi:hypothetical protein
MNQRLTVLNLLLLAALAAAGWQLRKQWREAEAREQAFLGQRVPAPPAPPAGTSPAAEPVTAASYLEVAEKMLFAKDRNPQVVVEIPPEKPLPPLPRVHGVMNLGDGLTVIMSEKPGERHKGVRVGEKIGEFQLAAVEGDQLVFAWENKQIKKRVDELIARGGDKPAEPAPADTETKREGGRIIPETPAAPAAPKPKGEAAPGREMGPGLAACQPGDDSPAGTEKDGMRKVITKTPFGDSCRWEAIR